MPNNGFRLLAIAAVDVIVTGLMMPRLNGFKLHKLLVALNRARAGADIGMPR